MPTCQCGKTVDDWRGARGHVQFTAGDGHGPKGEVPDDWKELFDEADDDEEADEREQQPDADDGGDEADPDPSEQPERDSGQSEASESKGRLRKALTDDIRHLWGGA